MYILKWQGRVDPAMHADITEISAPKQKASLPSLPEDKYPYPIGRKLSGLAGVGVWGKRGDAASVARRGEGQTNISAANSSSSTYHSTVAASKGSDIHGRVDWSSK